MGAGRGALRASPASCCRRIAPVLLMPLFYRFRPLDREALRERLLTLSRRAGVPVLGAFEWGLGEKTTRANAALVGVGTHPPHPRLRHAAQGLHRRRDRGDPGARDGAPHPPRHLDGAGGRDADRRRRRSSARTPPSRARRGRRRRRARRSGGAAAADPRGRRWFRCCSRPLGNAWSRYNERRADRFALDADRPSGRVHLGDAPPRAAEPRRGAAVGRRSSGSSTPTPPSTSASRPRRSSRPRRAAEPADLARRAAEPADLAE